MIRFKDFIKEDKGSAKHHLGINTSFAHMKQHAMAHVDTDFDGDVDKNDFEKTVQGEFASGDKQTPKMYKKFKDEKKHTRKGVAFE